MRIWGRRWRRRSPNSSRSSRRPSTPRRQAPRPLGGQRFDWRALPRPSRRVAAGVAIAAALAVATFLLLYRPPSDPEFDRGFADYSSSARGFESIPAWTTYYRAGSEGDLRFVEATGPVPLYSKQVFAVTPGKQLQGVGAGRA